MTTLAIPATVGLETEEVKLSLRRLGEHSFFIIWSWIINVYAGDVDVSPFCEKELPREIFTCIGCHCVLPFKTSVHLIKLILEISSMQNQYLNQLVW